MAQRRITPSLVISIVALVVALGGASYAAIKIPKNSVGTKQLKRNAVSTAKIKRGAVATARLKAGAVTAAKLRANSVGSGKVRDGSLVVGDFAPGQIPGDTWHTSRPDDPLFFDLTSDLATVVATPALEAGSYVVSARANILGGPASSTILCSLESDAAQNFTVAASSTFPLSMSGTAVLEEARPIELKCGKSAGTPRIAQANVIATRVPKVVRTPEEAP